MRGFARRIIYEDKYLLVVNKIAGQFTQEASSGTKKLTSRSLISEAALYLEDPGVGGVKEQSKRRRYVGLVHRLDTPTSGIVILAKTKEAARVLSKDLKNRTIEKHYLAVVNGAIPLTTQSQTLHHLITRPKGVMTAPGGARTQVIPTEGLSDEEFGQLSSLPHTQSATLIYTPLMHIALPALSLEKKGDVRQTAVHIELITGRKHQIRAQLSDGLGHPIVGDMRYGAPQRFRERDIALHAWGVAFRHPIHRSTRLTLVAPLHMDVDVDVPTAEGDESGTAAAAPAAAPDRQTYTREAGRMSRWDLRFGDGFARNVERLLRKKLGWSSH